MAALSNEGRLLGQSVDSVLGCQASKRAISDSIEGLPEFDVLIDFSTPDASLERLSECVEINKSVVVGTTGFGEDRMLTGSIGGAKDSRRARAQLFCGFNAASGFG